MTVKRVMYTSEDLEILHRLQLASRKEHDFASNVLAQGWISLKQRRVIESMMRKVRATYAPTSRSNDDYSFYGDDEVMGASCYHDYS